jgi:tryptophan synthase alpha chain
MMNRIDRIFQQKQKGLLSVYYTAGYPELDDTIPVIRELEKGGVDMIEIGMPFSDPLADGPVLQSCNQRSLENGMSMSKLFDQMKDVRKEISIPLLLMGYLNPVLNYGLEAFCKQARDCGMDGVILPDLPVQEYEKKYRKHFEHFGLHMIFLITPQTPESRIRRIAAAGRGFIYMVSAASTTGVKKGFLEEQLAYFDKIRNMDLDLPRMIGFGISSRASFRSACEYADGAIIGSAFMEHISREGNLSDKIPDFLSMIQ